MSLEVAEIVKIIKVIKTIVEIDGIWSCIDVDVCILLLLLYCCVVVTESLTVITPNGPVNSEVK